MNFKFCSLLVVTALITGCSYAPVQVKRRISFDELNRYEINCARAVQQINFLNSQRLSTDEERQSNYEVSKYNLLSNFNGIVDLSTPVTADHRQHMTNVHDDYNFYINLKITQINEYCLEHYVSPGECRWIDPESQACKNLNHRGVSRSRLH